MRDEIMPGTAFTMAVALAMGALVAATTAATAEPRPAATDAGASPPAAQAPAAAPVDAPVAVRPVETSAGRFVAARTFAPPGAGAGGQLHPPTRAVEADIGAFLDRFEGEWRGGGLVIPDAGDSPRRVSCTATGTSGPISVDIAGDCRILAIFKRDIGATLVHDGDRFTGTYVGSRVGDARLIGDIEDDTLVLTMEWPQEVNGDTTAEMRITNPGDGTLTLEVVDEFDGDGDTFVSTELVFEKVETTP